jgi:hypothetical protein
MIKKIIKSKVKPARRTTRNGIKIGHIYEVIKIDTDKKTINQNGDAKCTVYLKDKTTDENITRRGIARMWGNAGAVFIDSIEGYKNVQLSVSQHGTPAKIVCNSKTGGACWLADEYYW